MSAPDPDHGARDDPTTMSVGETLDTHVRQARTLGSVAVVLAVGAGLLPWQLSTSAYALAPVVWWAVPVLLAGGVAVQTRRSRVQPWLVGAAAVLTALCVASSWPIQVGGVVAVASIAVAARGAGTARRGDNLAAELSRAYLTQAEREALRTDG